MNFTNNPYIWTLLFLNGIALELFFLSFFIFSWFRARSLRNRSWKRKSFVTINKIWLVIVSSFILSNLINARFLSSFSTAVQVYDRLWGWWCPIFLYFIIFLWGHHHHSHALFKELRMKRSSLWYLPGAYFLLIILYNAPGWWFLILTSSSLYVRHWPYKRWMN